MRHRAAKGREAQRQRLEEIRHEWLRFLRFLSARGFNARSDCLRSLAARNSRIEAAVRRVGGAGCTERSARQALSNRNQTRSFVILAAIDVLFVSRQLEY